MSAYDDSLLWRAGLADADDVEAEALREDEMAETLDESFERLSTTALRIKADRDALLNVCKVAYEALDNVYDVDESEPGHYKEYPFSGAGGLLSALRRAIEKSEAA